MKRPRVLGQRPKAEQRRDYDAARSKAKPWRSWYSLAIWRTIRLRQLAEQPLCERCLAKDGRAVEATVVNHRTPHRGNWQLFIAGPFESLCKPHHDSDVQREERQAGGVGQSL